MKTVVFWVIYAIGVISLYFAHDAHKHGSIVWTCVLIFNAMYAANLAAKNSLDISDKD